MVREDGGLEEGVGLGQPQSGELPGPGEAGDILEEGLQGRRRPGLGAQAGRIGSVNHERGTFAPFPMYEAADCPETSVPAGPGGLPVSLNVTSAAGPIEQSDALAQARVRRRTLPGRTTVSGIAAQGVRTVTVRMPRDARTLRPAPDGTFLVFYDGEFIGSAEAKVTATLDNGRTVTGALPLMP